MGRRIAIVEDEPDIRENDAGLFRRQDRPVEICADRQTEGQTPHRARPDRGVLEIGLGDEVDRGFEPCRELRDPSTRVPVLSLTGCDGAIGAAVGLRITGDDPGSAAIGAVCGAGHRRVPQA